MTSPLEHMRTGTWMVPVTDNSFFNLEIGELVGALAEEGVYDVQIEPVTEAGFRSMKVTARRRGVDHDTD